MKKKILLLCLLFPLLVVLPSGCSGLGKPPAAATVYHTFKDTWSVVDAAMQSYGIEVRAGNVSKSTQDKIDSAHEKFRLAFLASIKVARQDWSATTPQSVGLLASELLALIPKK